ncbi:unnamed protein product [Brassica oleracea]
MGYRWWDPGNQRIRKDRQENLEDLHRYEGYGKLRDPKEDSFRSLRNFWTNGYIGIKRWWDSGRSLNRIGSRLNWSSLIQSHDPLDGTTSWFVSSDGGFRLNIWKHTLYLVSSNLSQRVFAMRGNVLCQDKRPWLTALNMVIGEVDAFYATVLLDKGNKLGQLRMLNGSCGLDWIGGV